VSPDVTAVNLTAVGQALDYLCSNYGQYCTQLYGADGRYAQCSLPQQATYVMNQYYQDIYEAEGDQACSFDGVGHIQWSIVPNTTVCHGMYNSLSCRTKFEDPSQMNETSIGLAVEYICNTESTLCSALGTSGPYVTCNNLQRASFAMDQYYKKFAKQQGASACDFGGQAQLLVQIAAPTTTTTTSGGDGNQIGDTAGASQMMVLTSWMLIAAMVLMITI